MKNVVVVGAGIVGLAVAYKLSRAGKSVRVVEKEKSVAAHQTGRNSGVVHSGVYYKPGSMKAKCCLEGRAELLEFCRERGVKVEKVGKVIVATKKEELERLEEIAKRGEANGVKLERVGKERLKEIEPHVEGLAAVHLPDVEIVSYGEVAEELAKCVQELGGCIEYGQEWRGGDAFTVYCAGLHSDRMAGSKDCKIVPFRGEYYELKKPELVKGLIYPVPDPRLPFLGVHLTRHIDGSVGAGPNAVLAFAREGYRWSDINVRDCLEMMSFPGFWKVVGKYWKTGAYEMARSLSKKLFLRDVRALMPQIQVEDLVVSHAGVRAQVVTRSGELMYDFAVERKENAVHVVNAPSPAATASFAIANRIMETI